MMQVLSDRFEVSGRNFDMQLGGSTDNHQTVRTVSEKVMSEIRERQERQMSFGTTSADKEATPRRRDLDDKQVYSEFKYLKQ